MDKMNQPPLEQTSDCPTSQTDSRNATEFSCFLSNNFFSDLKPEDIIDCNQNKTYSPVAYSVNDLKSNEIDDSWMMTTVDKQPTRLFNETNTLDKQAQNSLIDKQVDKHQSTMDIRMKSKLSEKSTEKVLKPVGEQIVQNKKPKSLSESELSIPSKSADAIPTLSGLYLSLMCCVLWQN